MDETPGRLPQIAMVGFGEAAQAFVAGWQLGGSRRVRAFDIKSFDPVSAASMADLYRGAGVDGGADIAGVLQGARQVFCLVTADQAVAAAREAARHLAPSALWFDGNSCSPGSKRAAAALVEAAGGRYVDVAVMAPVHPSLHRTPLLLSGDAAEVAARALRALDMRPEVVGARVGDASAVKMIRSVMVKGLEALTAECLLAARRAGVDHEVIASLQASHPHQDWPRQMAYNLERMIVHGKRRAAEMREVAATLRELAMPDRMSSATAQWQEEVATLGLEPGEANALGRADRVLAALGSLSPPVTAP